MFTVNIADTSPSTTADCTEDLIERHRFGNLMEIPLQGFGDSDTQTIDVSDLVQQAVNSPDWESVKDTITFVISQKQLDCANGEDIVIDEASTMSLNIFYDDFKPRKYKKHSM